MQLLCPIYGDGGGGCVINFTAWVGVGAPCHGMARGGCGIRSVEPTVYYGHHDFWDYCNLMEIQYLL